MQNIRNFSIIAHIDHGKSTLADRLIETCGTHHPRKSTEQVLDSMDLERERGITIKAQTAALHYVAKNGERYQFNLIDTPGHVDFSYEVSRSLSACEGALLVVDASQGVEAQTVANCYSAIDLGVEVLPIINKMDLPQADAKRASAEIEEIIGIDAQQALGISAKTGQGISELLELIVNKIPAPHGNPNAALRALIIDSWFDNYVGVVMLVRIVDGKLNKGDKIMLMANQMHYQCDALGVFTPTALSKTSLETGAVGFVTAGIKALSHAKVGDTITHVEPAASAALPGFKVVKPQVFAGLYPIESHEFEALREALQKLQLNDSALFFEPEVSSALGFGFRCGFLGLLHMDIVQERLEREYNMSLVTTAPSVNYQVLLSDGTELVIQSPAQLPEVSKVSEIREPFVKMKVFCPKDYVGNIITLCINKRGIQKDLGYFGLQAVLTFEMPLAEIVLDFFDRMKSATRGYASMDYEFLEYRNSNVVKMDILLNSDRVDALSLIVHRSASAPRARQLVSKMRELIPRQMFDVAIQASIGSNVIARETVKAMRKNVLAKCYGGDISRKRKLLEKQKAGKRRMKQVGNVEVPQEAFLALLQTD